MKKKMSIALSLAVLLLAVYFRLHGVNWDQNQHLHPDERFLTMVTQGISWPTDIREYLDTARSPLNPHNRGFDFFVYGTFPIFFTKWVIDLLGMGDYNSVTLIGRQLSAGVDVGTVFLVYLIARSYLKTLGHDRSGVTRVGTPPSACSESSSYVPLLSSLFYASMVLPIQLSHFYAVDTYVTFFLTLSFYLLNRLLLASRPFGSLGAESSGRTPETLRSFRLCRVFRLKEIEDFTLHASILLGISFGLALASKITAALFLPIIGFGFLWCLATNKNKIRVLVSCFLFIVSCFLAFRFTQPYLFVDSRLFDLTLNPRVIGNWKELQSFDGKDTWFPPSVQWIHTKPYLFPLKNLILWGVGLPLSMLFIGGFSYAIATLSHVLAVSVRKKSFSLVTNRIVILLLTVTWIALLFLYQGAQFSKNMRYFLPIYPFLALVSGNALSQFFFWVKKHTPKLSSLIFCFLGLVLVYPVSFISLYFRPHSRVAASEWIYNNIPFGTTIGGEHWDDFIPLGMDGKSVWTYKPVELPLYGADTQEKWRDLDTKLKDITFIILSSNRLYGSIMTVPERYPITSRYYQALFDGSLGFKKVAEFTSRPNLPLPFVKVCLIPPFTRYGIVARKNQECPLPGFSLVDDYADESFTVYDHPKVVIFKKAKPIHYFEFLVKSP